MIIPLSQLSADILDNIIQEFVLREGTDYGLEDTALEHKKRDVKRQLQDGTAVIVYSQLHETVNIMPKAQFEQSQDIEHSIDDESANGDEQFGDGGQLNDREY